MADQDEPDRTRATPVSSAALDTLLGAVAAVIPGDVPGLGLVDRAVAAQHARRFKLDVSFALPLRTGVSSGIRFSVNDKGEPDAFRARLAGILPELGVPPERLAALLAVAAPGRVQTTAAVKFRPGSARPDRVTVYLEELHRDPDAEDLASGFFRAAGLDGAPAPIPGTRRAAVSADLAGGEVVGVRDYGMVETDDASVALPGPLSRWRDALPRHAFHGTRRFLVARRFDLAGRPAGDKLLWMLESHRPEAAAAAWRAVDERTADVVPGDPVATALALLRASWTHAPGCFLHPDLVSLDVDRQGRADLLLVYVSVR